jgi:glycosyltransferase involved in cell wall biosynthesis
MRPTLSIVVPTFNGGATLRDQLDALEASIDDQMEVVVVDNRSTDDTARVIAGFAAQDQRFRSVAAFDRQGEAYARNVGLQSARSDRVAFCDADDVVAPDWARSMRDALGSTGFVTGPVELDRLNPPWLAAVRGRRIFEQLPRTVRDIPFAHGCNIGVRVHDALAIGGFDERVRIGTDIDFAVRANAAGLALTWEPRAVVHYRHRPTALQRFRQAAGYGRASSHLHELVGDDWTARRRVAAQRRRARWLLGTIPRLASRAHRAQWLWTLALVYGEIRGRER